MRVSGVTTAHSSELFVSAMYRKLQMLLGCPLRINIVSYKTRTNYGIY